MPDAEYWLHLVDEYEQKLAVSEGNIRDLLVVLREYRDMLDQLSDYMQDTGTGSINNVVFLAQRIENAITKAEDRS